MDLPEPPASGPIDERAALPPSPARTAWAIFALALALRLLFCFVVVPASGLDMGPGSRDFYTSCDGYVHLAANLVDHHKLSFRPEAPPTLFRPPAFPVAVGIVYAVLGNAGVALVLVNCLASATTAVLVYLLARRLFDPRTARWSGIMAACFPLAVYYTANGFADPFLAFVVVAYVWATVALIQEPIWRWGVLSGVIFGVAMLTKPVVLPLALLLLLVAILRHRAMLAPVLLSLAVGGLFVGGWTARNYALADKFILVSVGSGYNLLVGNMMADTRGNADEVYDRGVTRALDRVEQDQGIRVPWSDIQPYGHYDLAPQTDALFAASARRTIRDDPLVIVRKFLVNLGRFWYLSTSTTKGIANAVVNGTVVLLALAGLWRLTRYKPCEAMWLTLFMLGYVGTYCLVIVSSSRFCLPVVALLLPFAVETALRIAGKPPARQEAG